MLRSRLLRDLDAEQVEAEVLAEFTAQLLAVLTVPEVRAAVREALADSPAPLRPSPRSQPPSGRGRRR